MSLIVNIADSIVTILNAGTFTPTFTAVLEMVPYKKLEDIGSARVVVVPRDVSYEVTARKIRLEEFGIDIGIQSKLTGPETGDDAAIKTMVTLTESIKRHMYRRDITAYGAHWIASENDPIYDVEMLRNLRVFSTAISLTYRTMVDA
jgi:hypothetical protein